VVLVWKKRIWRCEQDACPVGSWRETSTQIRPRTVLTERARKRVARRVGREAQPVATVAADYGVGWHTVNDAMLEHGQEMLAADTRLEGVAAVGLDEHNFLRGTFRSPTSWVSGFVDLETGRLLDVVENRTAAG
jgi:transposase